MNHILQPRRSHLQERQWQGARVLVLCFLGMVFALSAVAEPGHGAKFHSGTHRSALAFRAPVPRSVQRQLAAEHSRLINCECQVVTADNRPVYRSAKPVPMSKGLPQLPEVTSCLAPTGSSFTEYFVPSGAVTRRERMTLGACEALDGKTYRSEGSQQVACSKHPCVSPRQTSIVEVERCDAFDAEKQPAFWDCRPSAL